MKILSSILGGALAVSVAIGGILPAAAAPVFVPKAQSASEAQALDIQYRRNGNNRYERNRFERRGDRAFYNGQRGYRERRSGYRQYNGFWFPSSAFIAGAIIGGALNQPQARPASSAHVRWCANRYRSYDARSDTYVPRAGVRAACNSPYS